MVDVTVDVYIEQIYAAKSNLLNQLREALRVTKNPNPQKPEEYKVYIGNIKKLRETLTKMEIKYSLDKVRELLEQQLAESSMAGEIDSLSEKYEKMIEDKKKELEEEARRANQEQRNKLAASNQVYLELEEKRKILESYSEQVTDACHKYGVTSMDVAVSNSTFTVDELNALYDQYIAYMRKPGSTRNILRQFREKVSNPYVQGGILLMVGILAFTTMFDLFAIAWVGYLAFQQNKVAKQAELYAMLLGLIYNIQPLKLGFREMLDEGSLIEEVVSEEDERLADIINQYEEDLNVVSKQVEEKEDKRNRVMQEFLQKAEEIQEKFVEKQEVFNDEKQMLMDLLAEKIENAEQELEELRSKYKPLGTEISSSAVFSTKFRLGLREEMMDEVIDVGLSNLVIKPSTDVQALHRFIQVLLINAMSNVKAGNLKVYVFDPNDMGQVVIELFDKEYEDLFILASDDLGKLVSELSKSAKDNMRVMKSLDINSFNAEAERLGKVERRYQLLLVLSQPKKIEENEALSQFMTYSARLGVFVWLVSTKKIKGTYQFNTPFEGVKQPYPLAVREFGKRFTKMFSEARKKNLPAALPWENFIKILCPEEKMWTYSGNEFIDIDPGLEEGDPDKSTGYTVGNVGDIHVLAVGKTGGGKSVFLNSLIANMCQKYAPTDLQLWLIDYKCLEFGFFLPKPGQEYTFPHIKACLCTTDGDYAESVYRAFSEECERRFRVFEEIGQKNLKGYNQAMERNGTPEKRLPRIVFINDEFQVIFEKATGKILDSINKSLTTVAKLGRAAGCHMMFTSQSMKGTVKADVLQQFTLRFALKCAEDVSTEILGTKKASDMVEPYGFVIAASEKDKTKESQKKYKVPFLDDKHPDVLLGHMKKLWDEAEHRHLPKNDLIQYDEKVEHSITELQAYYEALNRDVRETPETGLILLGNRMTYAADNKAPENIIMTNDRSSSIFAVFANTVDIVDFYRMMIMNLSMFRQKAQLFVNAQVEGLHYVCEVEKEMQGQMECFSSVNVSVAELLGMFEAMYKSRVESGTENIAPAYFILLGWDAAEGFGVNRDPAITSRMTELVKKGGEYGMHFIFICSSVATIAASFIEACAFKIAGACDEKSSYAVLDTKQGSQPSDKPDGFLYLRTGNAIPTRAKLYISPKTREISKKKFVL